MRTLFFLGAGASYGSGDCTFQGHSTAFTTPPLGLRLYDALCHYGSGFAEATKEFAPIFREDFEKGMEVAGRAGLAPYIQKLTAHYLFLFFPGEANLYIRLLTGARRYLHRYAFASLNYDLLLERSAASIGLGIAHYTAGPVPANLVPLAKPHGSCNLLPRDGGALAYENFFEGLFDNVFGFEAEFCTDDNQTLRFLSDFKNQITPAMCYYARGKGTLVGRVTIDRQYQLFRKMVYRFDQIIIIDVRVNREDSHIWDTLSDTPATIVYFGKDLEDFIKWAENRPDRSIPVSGYFDDAVRILEQHSYNMTDVWSTG